MDESVRHTISVSTGRGLDRISFHFLFHKTSAVGERLLAADFYTKWRQDHKVPEGEHYEIEILAPFPWGDVVPEQVHIAIPSGSERVFICYLATLPSFEKAWAMVVEWSIGTTFALTTGEDFAPLLHESGPTMFRQRMFEEFGIQIIDAG